MADALPFRARRDEAELERPELTLVDVYAELRELHLRVAPVLAARDAGLGTTAFAAIDTLERAADRREVI